MTRVEATCPTCGVVECTLADLMLGVCSFRPASYYAFECPSCEEWVSKKAESPVIDILVAEGVQPFHFDPPIEALERPTEGAVINENDILDMMLLIERDDWFSQLQRAQA